MSRASTPLAVFLAFAARFSAGCAPSVGPCDDEAAARTVVYADSAAAAIDGVPAYAGQALVDRSCGGGSFCHAPTATDRFGAPFHLNFDVRIACSNTDESCDFERLADAQLDVFAGRDSIFRDVSRGLMPPGSAGARIATHGTAYRTGADPGSPELPAVESPEGREILRNWLACGAPVIERTLPESTVLYPGDDCTNSDVAEIGDCRVRSGDGLAVPEPTWSSIYSEVIEPFCTRCHSSSQNEADRSDLSLDDPSTAYAALIDVPAAGEECAPNANGGRVFLRIDLANPEASLLLRKFSDDPPCGDPMPIAGRSIPSDAIQVIEEWIASGAPRDRP